MAQGHSGINPADPGPSSLGRLLWALSDNVDRMIVKNREGTERQVSEKSGPFMKIRNIRVDRVVAGLGCSRLVHICWLVCCFYQESIRLNVPSLRRMPNACTLFKF